MPTAVTDLFAGARTALAGLPQQELGQWHTPRVLGIARPARIISSGRAWHLGVLLIADDAVLAVGSVIRAREQVPRGYAATSQRQRADIAAAAHRGGFPEGVPIHLDWRLIDLEALERVGEAEPLAIIGGVPQVRWTAAAGHRPLADYLVEQIDLLRRRAGG